MKNNFVIKILVGFLFLINFNWNAFSQDEVFNKGNMIINAGIGAGSWITDNPGYSMKLFPIVGSFEYGVADLFDSKGGIGIGGYAAFTGFGNKVGQNVSDLIIGVRGIFHYQFVEKLDTYAGFLLGYDIKSYLQSDPKLPGSSFYPGSFIGARYYLTNNIGVFSELSIKGAAPLELGVCYIF